MNKMRIDLQLFATTVTPAKKYMKIVDKIYKDGKLTGDLDAPEALVLEGKNAKSILIAKTSVDGLRNYDKATGYPTANATFEWEEHTFAVDRGSEILIDNADNMETLDLAFTALADDLLRNSVIPEVDAYRIATLAGRAEAGATVEENLTNSTALQAWDDAVEYMSDSEVPLDNLVAYVSSEFMKYLKQSNLITRQMQIDEESGRVVNRWINVLDDIRLVKVPRNRLYTEITLRTGAEAGYVKTPTTGRDINFLLVDKQAGLGITKISKLKTFAPEVNQTSDSYKIQFRTYHDIFTMDNKRKGIYVNHKTS